VEAHGGTADNAASPGMHNEKESTTHVVKSSATSLRNKRRREEPVKKAQAAAPLKRVVSTLHHTSAAIDCLLRPTANPLGFKRMTGRVTRAASSQSQHSTAGEQAALSQGEQSARSSTVSSAQLFVWFCQYAHSKAPGYQSFAQASLAQFLWYRRFKFSLSLAFRDFYISRR